MKIVIFGLTTGTGHDAAHSLRWRALVQALAIRGHRVIAVERAGPGGAAAPWTIPGGEWLTYDDWDAIAPEAARQADDSGVALAVAHGPDARAAAGLVRESRSARRVLYDPDAPASLAALEVGEGPAHLPAGGLGGFDLVLTSSGGPALDAYREKTGADGVTPLYPWIVPEAHKHGHHRRAYHGDLCCVAPDARAMGEGLDRFFIEPAQRLARRRFVLAGGHLPDVAALSGNIAALPDFDLSHTGDLLASATLTLALARDDERRVGWCPTDRLLEAAARGAAIVSDRWDGVETFFEPGREILVAAQTDDVTTAMMLPRNHLADLGQRARKRALAEHSAERRVQELRGILDLKGGGDD
ncbi:glycosyltransferase family protein [Azospirillum agricola]|uniref:glycosyltransferase family protein n=1 Tax=Azospirillum agricola TaxID=1720247 RepID=UPI000A0F1117|nr:glycosyltransferase [Azospirillum agricola]SMH58768.1 Spore maturation protein CgeB [Azospirillum lipoferum]